MSPRLSGWLLVLLLLGGGATLVALWWGRMDTGARYARFSSLRPDDYGTRLLFDTLAALPGRTVERNFIALEDRLARRPDWESAPQTTWIRLGQRLQRGRFAELNGPDRLLDHVAAGGGRLVLALTDGIVLLPHQIPEGADWEERRRWWRRQQANREGPTATETEENGAEEDGAKEEDADSSRTLVSRLPWWERIGLEVELTDPALVPPFANGIKVAGRAPWQVWQRQGVRAVVLRRTWGQGEVVVVSDATALSRGGLRGLVGQTTARWVAGAMPTQHYIFDETHLGAPTEDTIASLLHRYGLTPALVLLGLTGLLWLWRSLTPLALPAQSWRRPDEGAGAVVRPPLSAAGALAILLRRSLPPAQLLEQCLSLFAQAQPPPRQSAVAPLVAEGRVLARSLAEAPAQGRPAALLAVWRQLADKFRPFRLRG